MVKNILKQSIYTALLMAGTAQAADVYTMSNGNFDFYDANGVLSAQYPDGFSHSNVFADGTTNTGIETQNITAGNVTASGTTATVILTDHGYTTGTSVIIADAEEAEYNGTYTITVVDANTFTYTFAGSATSPATTIGGITVSKSIVSQSLDFTNGTGRLVTTTSFSGANWVADVAAIVVYDAATYDGVPQRGAYTWLEKTYQNTFDNSSVKICRIAGSIDNCAALEADSEWAYLNDTVVTGVSEYDGISSGYSYTLEEGQFALHLFFDWSGNDDIPVLAIFDIDSIAADGSLTTISVNKSDAGWCGVARALRGVPEMSCDPVALLADTTKWSGPAGDGVPGSKMQTSPFPEQTPVFSGVLVPVTNDVPVTGVSAASDPLTTNEDTAITLALTDFDFNAAAFPSGAFITASKTLFIGTGTDYTTNGTSSVTPATNFPVNAATGALTVPVGITILGSNSSTQDVSITVNAVGGDAPSISGTPASQVAAGDAYSFTPVATDPDFGDTLTFSFTDLPSWISTSNTTTGEISGTPTAGDVGTTTGIGITVTDTLDGTSVSLDAFQIEVTANANTAPTIVSGAPLASLSTDEDALFSFTVVYDDVDLAGTDALTCFISGNPTWMTVSPITEQTSSPTCMVSGTPNNDQIATTLGITVGVRDRSLAETSSTFDITVNNTNDTPTISAGTCTDSTMEAGFDFAGCTPAFSDDDTVNGEVLTFAATGLPSSLTIAPATGVISGATIDGDDGVYAITVTVSDDEAVPATASFTFNLTITAFIEAPVALGASLSTPQDVVIDTAADLNDQYGALVELVTGVRGCEPGCLEFSVPPGGQAQNGAVVINSNGDFVYTPDAGYNGRDFFKYVVSDGVKTSDESVINLVVGVIEDDEYLASNFTMIDRVGVTFGGSNDVVATWNGQLNTDVNDVNFDYMTLSTLTPFNGKPWTAHHIRVFGPGEYTFDTTCTLAQLEGNLSCADNNLQTEPKQQIIRNVTMTVGEGQIGAHILFDWSATENIDVLVVWDIDAKYSGPDLNDPEDPLNDPSHPASSASLYQGIGYGPYPWANAPSFNTKWRMASQDVDGDGIGGMKMVDGPFQDFQANFNLDIVTDASNMTLLSADGTTLDGTNNVNANWTGATTAALDSTDFAAMRLSSSSNLTVGSTTAGWEAHHIRVFSEGTYEIDTNCSATDLEAGTTDCAGIKVSMTVAEGQIGVHMLIDWNTDTDIHVVNVFETASEDQVFEVGALFTGGDVGNYPWSSQPVASDTRWRMVSIDVDGDGVPGAAIVSNGELNGQSINFNLFVAGGGTEVAGPEPHKVDDPSIGGSSSLYELIAIYMLWLSSGLVRRRVNISKK